MSSELGKIFLTKAAGISFVTRCMQKVGTDAKQATVLGQVLLEGDYRGHYSHGLNRLEMYVNDIKTGTCVSKGVPTIIKQTAATAHVDGNNLLGPPVAKYCMNLAIEKALSAGVGWVATKGSNHFGIAGYYSMMASERRLMGMAFTNTSPFMVPTRGSKPVLGTNPITLAAPCEETDPFVLDMATTSVAVGKVEICSRRQEEVPIGWGVDTEGRALAYLPRKETTESSAAQLIHETKDPDKIFPKGGLMPLGGPERTSGYKGYGLGMLVEIFCGILSGGAYGPNVRKWMTHDRPANLGQCFIAVDPNAFAPGFTERLSDLMKYCRSQKPSDDSLPVLVAGDPELKFSKMCDDSGGIPYHDKQIQHLHDLAARLEVEPVPTFTK